MTVSLSSPLSIPVAHRFRKQKLAWRDARGVSATPAGLSALFSPSAPVLQADERACAQGSIVLFLEADPWCELHSLLSHLRAGTSPHTDPPDAGLVVALHIRFAVSPTVKDSYPLLLLFWQLFAQLRHHLFHRRTQMLFIGAIAIQRSRDAIGTSPS